MRAQVAAIALTAAAIGCDSTDGQLPLAKAARTKPAGSVRSADDTARLNNRIEFIRHSLRRRLNRPLELPKRPKARACPDDEIAERVAAPKAQGVVVLVRDARPASRVLLPLRMTRAVTQQEWTLSDVMPGARDDAEQRLAELEATFHRRYAVVFHITLFQAPKWVRKPDKNWRPEWIAGWVRGFVSVFDLETGAGKCRAELSVRNDVSEAPLSVRMKSQTRDALTRELGVMLREEGARALAGITEVLRLPDSDRRSEPTKTASRPLARD